VFRVSCLGFGVPGFVFLTLSFFFSHLVFCDGDFGVGVSRCGFGVWGFGDVGLGFEVSREYLGLVSQLRRERPQLLRAAFRVQTFSSSLLLASLELSNAKVYAP